MVIKWCVREFVSTNAADCLEKHTNKMAYYMSNGQSFSPIFTVNYVIFLY